MAIEVTCPKCSKQFYADHALMGRRARCLGCGGPVDVPVVKAVAVRIEQDPEPFVPATAKQIAFLRSLGVQAPKDASMEDATRMIREALDRQKQPSS